MAGRNQSVNLQGMLGDIANTVGSLAEPYDFVSDTIRNVARPSVAMDDSASLTKYAAWARRNGLDEEAARYEALAYRQKEVERELAKQARTDMGNSAVAYNMKRIQQIKADPTLKADKKFELIRQAQDAIDASSRATSIDGTRFANAGAQALQDVSDKAVETKYRKDMNALQNRAEGLYRNMQFYETSDPKYAVLESSYNSVINNMNELSQTSAGGDGSREGDLFVAGKLQQERAAAQEGRAVKADLRQDKADARADDEAERAEAREARAEARAPYELQSAQNQAISSAYTAQAKIDDAAGRSAANVLVKKGIYDPRQLPDDLAPAARAEAITLLDSARESTIADEEARSKGTVSSFYMTKAESMAQYTDGNPSNKIAALLEDYNKIVSRGDPVIAGERIGAAKRLIEAVKEQEALANSADGELKYVAGGELKKLAELDDASGLFENDTYKEVLSDTESFNEMRRGLAEYMQTKGITQFATISDLYAAMDEVAPTLSGEKWKTATNYQERARDQAKIDFDQRFGSAEEAFIKEFSDKTIEAEPVWSQYPEDLKERASEQFQTEVANVSEFFNPQKWQGGITRDPQTRALFTPQMSMIFNNSNEWASVVEMVGPEWAAEIEARARAGLPVRLEDFDW